MTDAYATLREMLANVPDDAQVYVEELESIVEWPGITAGTFRALLAEVAGFEAMWEAREKAHDAEVAAVRAETLREVEQGVWPEGHLGSCPASTNLPDDGPEDTMWCDCGYERFTALAQPEGTE